MYKMPEVKRKKNCQSLSVSMKRISIENFPKGLFVDYGEPYGSEKASLADVLTLVEDFQKVVVNRHQPPKISLVYVKNCMRALGILPRFWNSESASYVFVYIFFMMMMMVFAMTITCDLYEASQDILQLGEDLVVLIGIYLVILKLLLSAYYAKDIEHIIWEFGKVHKYFSQLHKSPGLVKIRRLQRLFFVIEVTSLIFYMSLSVVFTIIMSLCPILTNSGLTPYRAKFPFTFSSYSDNPLLFTSVYVFQTIMTLFTLVSVVLIDNLGCHIFTQTTLNLKILCIRIREIGSNNCENRLEELHTTIKFHQYLISLINKINHVFYHNYAFQMAASTLMICLTAFESMLAQDQPLLAIKFQIYMFSAFCQLFYWCATGNTTYYNSLSVADAAYEIEHWYEQSPEFGYCVSFLIKRAQTPLVFRPKPLFCFNFDTFVSILSTSYSYFAMLNTMNN